MAKYSREFLIPYLEGICALYCAKDKLYKEKNKVESEIARLKKGSGMKMPEEPERETGLGAGRTLALILGIFFLFLGMGVLTIENGATLSLSMVFFMIGGVAIGLIPLSCKNRDEEYEENMIEYQEQMKEYESIMMSDEEARKEIPYLKQVKAYIIKELRKINYLVECAYNINIIPTRYRDRYAVTYLYDWFATSGSDDMDMALSIYVLEEIKERLDTIIDQMSESLLNQRVMIANQQASIDQQDEHGRMMQNKLDQLQTTEEERLRYEKMIESNTAMNAYFAAANYLK